MTAWETPEEPADVTTVADSFDDVWKCRPDGQWTNGVYELSWPMLLAQFGPVYDDND